MPLLFTKRLFNSNVMICGERGTGKDMLMANVIARRRARYYISPFDYKIKNKLFKKYWVKLDLKRLCIDNSYRDFINSTLHPYYYPYPEKCDIYLPDCGVYLPSTYCNELTKEYKDLPAFFALSRHLGNANIHCNAQSLNRVWDKIREQSSTYIKCLKCIVVFGYVIQVIRIYERYDSALANIAPFRAPKYFTKDKTALVEQSRVNYINQHGTIKTRLLIYKNKSNYNSRYFKNLLETGVAYET